MFLNTSSPPQPSTPGDFELIDKKSRLRSFPSFSSVIHLSRHSFIHRSLIASRSLLSQHSFPVELISRSIFGTNKYISSNAVLPVLVVRHSFSVCFTFQLFSSYKCLSTAHPDLKGLRLRSGLQVMYSCSWYSLLLPSKYRIKPSILFL